MAIITINGKKYNDKKLNQNTKNHLESLNITNNEIKRLNALIAINKTSKNAYSSSVLNNLPEKTAAANRKNGIIIINEKKYLVDDLSDKLKNEIQVLNTINKNLSELQIQLAILITAKNAYSKALMDSLEK